MALRRLGSPEPDVVAVVFAHWEELVGERAAAHLRPLRVADGTLFVSADHPVWATQMRSIADQVRARLAALSGHAPDRIEVVVRRP